MTSQPKNMYIDKVDELVNEYNNTYHIITFYVAKMIKILKFKSVIMSEYWNIKTYLPKIALQISQKTFLWLKTLKILYHELM